MVSPAKITLSSQELQFVTDTEWILTKRVIIDKVYLLMGDLCEKMKVHIENEKEWLPKLVTFSEPKIYKGENYLQLPYVLLDYPRCFNATDIFAIRTMFWWGNFFSITIHLSGCYKKMFEKAIYEKRTAFEKGNYYLGINEDQWQHHFNADNYCKVSSIEAERFNIILKEKMYIKLALQFSLQQWNDIPDLLEKSFLELLQLLKA